MNAKLTGHRRRLSKLLRQFLCRVVESVDNFRHCCDRFDGGVVRRISLGTLENHEHSGFLKKETCCCEQVIAHDATKYANLSNKCYMLL